MKVYYRRHAGTMTSEPANFIDALGPLKDLYGRTNARDFGPLGLKAARHEMIRPGWCRTHINRHVNRIKDVFKWGTAPELIPGSLYEALRTVAALSEGRTAAREPDPATTSAGILLLGMSTCVPRCRRLSIRGVPPNAEQRINEAWANPSWRVALNPLFDGREGSLPAPPAAQRPLRGCPSSVLLKDGPCPHRVL